MIFVYIFFAIAITALLCVVLVKVFGPHNYKGEHNTLHSTSEVRFVKPTNGTPYLIKVNADGTNCDEPFTVLSCTDLHLRTDKSEISLSVLGKLVDKVKPDLVVLLGDNVVGRDDTVMQDKLRQFFDSRKLHWAFVLGNHDSEYKINCELAKLDGKVSESQMEQITMSARKWMFDSLSCSPYCVCYNAQGIYGVGNCVVNICNSDGIKQSLFFFDSGDYVFGVKRKAYGSEKRCYGYIRKSQLDWYVDQLDKLTRENNGTLPKSIAFFHIPLQEYHTAYKGIWTGKSTRLYGANYEKPCFSDLNDGALDTFVNCGSTHITVCGHDHKNDSNVLYKGIRLMYSQGLPYGGAYNRRKKSKLFKLLNKLDDKTCYFTEGVSIFTVNNDGSVDTSVVYAERENAFVGLEQYYDRAYITGTLKK